MPISTKNKRTTPRFLIKIFLVILYNLRRFHTFMVYPQYLLVFIYVTCFILRSYLPKQRENYEQFNLPYR